MVVVRVNATPWRPVFLADHLFGRTGFWARRIEVNGRTRWHLWRSPGQEPPLPLVSCLGEVDTHIPPWTIAAFGGMVLLPGRIRSCGGYRQVELPEAARLYRPTKWLIPYARHRQAAEICLRLLNQPAIVWRVATGIERALLLEDCGEVPVYGTVFLPDLGDADARVGGIDLWRLPPIDVQLWWLPQIRTMYHHRVAVKWWMRWYADGAATAIAYLTGLIEAPQEAHTVEEGWYLLRMRHPQK